MVLKPVILTYVRLYQKGIIKKGSAGYARAEHLTKRLTDNSKKQQIKRLLELI